MPMAFVRLAGISLPRSGIMGEQPDLGYMVHISSSGPDTDQVRFFIQICARHAWAAQRQSGSG